MTGRESVGEAPSGDNEVSRQRLGRSTSTGTAHPPPPRRRLPPRMELHVAKVEHELPHPKGVFPLVSPVEQPQYVQEVLSQLPGVLSRPHEGVDPRGEVEVP